MTPAAPGSAIVRIIQAPLPQKQLITANPDRHLATCSAGAVNPCCTDAKSKCSIPILSFRDGRSYRPK